jgi:hypothetical protein
MDPDTEDTYFGMGSASTGTPVPVPIEAKLRTLSVRVLYEVCRVQNLSVQDLRELIAILMMITFLLIT